LPVPAEVLADYPELVASVKVPGPIPITVKGYHGSDRPGLTGASLQPKDPGYEGSLGPGIYLGEKRETAEFYGKYVTPVEVRLSNPLLIDPENVLYENRQPRLRIYENRGSILIGEDMQPFDVIAPNGEVFEVRDGFSLRHLASWAKSKGFDGIIMRNMRAGGGGEEIVAFDKSSILPR